VAGVNGDVGNRLLWWLMGIFSVMIVSLVGVTLSKMNTMQDEISSLKVADARIDASLRQVDIMAVVTREEQMKRTAALSAVDSRLINLEYGLKNCESRLNTQSERLLQINKRLDSRGIGDKGEMQ